MGYKSDVAYLITGKKDAVIAFITKLRLIVSDAELALREVTVSVAEPDGISKDERLNISFRADSVKWYDEYVDVKPHELLWGQAIDFSAEDDALHGVFIRIGEDDDDIEQRSFGSNPPHDMISVYSSINMDIDPKKETDIRATMGIV